MLWVVFLFKKSPQILAVSSYEENYFISVWPRKQKINYTHSSSSFSEENSQNLNLVFNYIFDSSQ